MDRRSFTAAVTRGSAAAVFGAQRVSAAPPSGPVPQARNVVLVHGAYADGSCWSEVIPYLQARGLNVPRSRTLCARWMRTANSPVAHWI